MSRPRHVRGLRSVAMTDSGPFPTPTPSKLPRRAAEGIRYQKRALDKLQSLDRFGDFYRDQWFVYTDANGRHWCQTDGLLAIWDRVIVFEIKLSLRRLETGLAQLTKLYKPTVGAYFDKPVVPCLVFKHWVPGADLNLIDNPEELLSYRPSAGACPVGWNFYS